MCKKCDYSNTQASNLKRHMRMHAEVVYQEAPNLFITKNNFFTETVKRNVGNKLKWKSEGLLCDKLESGDPRIIRVFAPPTHCNPANPANGS